MAEGDVTIEIKKPETLVMLAFLGLLLFMELQVSFATPISFGDEGFHTRTAQWIGQNAEYPVWIPFTQSLAGKAGFDRPPFWNILEGGMFWLLGFHETIPKMVTPFVSVLGGLALYLGAKRFYGERIGFVAAALLVTFPSVVTYALVFYTDALVTFFMVMFLLTLAIALTGGRRLCMLAAGTFGALTLMTKVVGYTAYALIAIILLYELVRNRKPFELLGRYWPMLIMMALIPSTYMLRNYVYYGTPMCYDLPLFSDVFDMSGCSVIDYTPTYQYAGRTEQVGTEASVLSMGLTNYLDFAYGNLWLVMTAFFAGLIIIADAVRKARTQEGGVLTGTVLLDFALLAMLALYAALFVSGTITPRAEDTARFSLIWAPVVALAAAKYVDLAYDFVKKGGFNLMSICITAISIIYASYVAYALFGAVATIILFTASVASIALTKNPALSIIIMVLVIVLVGSTTKLATMYQVKQFSPMFFEACDWVEANTPGSSILSTVWTYRSAYSCQRNVVGSDPDMALSNNVTHILSTANRIGVTHIFVQKFSLSDQSLSEKYPIDYVRLLEANPDHFKKIYENGVALETCIQQGGCDGNIVYEIIY